MLSLTQQQEQPCNPRLKYKIFKEVAKRTEENIGVLPLQ